jgi:hypothetical protein
MTGLNAAKAKLLLPLARKAGYEVSGLVGIF